MKGNLSPTLFHFFKPQQSVFFIKNLKEKAEGGEIVTLTSLHILSSVIIPQRKLPQSLISKKGDALFDPLLS